MPETLREVMTPNPVTMPGSSTLADAARCMRDRDIGDVLVTDGDRLCGMVTDRDIVVRALAEGKDPATCTLDDICSHRLHSVSPDDAVETAVDMMRSEAIRRLPVVEGGTAVGMVSIGDLAIDRDPNSALADISQAPPNN